MGHGGYDTSRSTIRSANYKRLSREEVFQSRSMNKDMSPNGLLFREARDSDDHPNSLPIVVALDVTGSMGRIPHALVTGGLTKIMGNIIQNGIPDPQVLFMGIGDHECDSAPLQVGQFESSDDLLDKWLTSTWLEGGGGGNDGESYLLAWYAAARYTRTDHWEKRGKKGLLFTIGDEPFLTTIPARAQQSIMGNGSYEDLSAEDILKEVTEKWDVFHINVAQTWRGSQDSTQNQWKQLLGSRCVVVDEFEDVPTTIARLVAEHQGVQNAKITNDENELAFVSSSVNGPSRPDLMDGVI